MESSPLPQPNPIHHPRKKGDIREPSQPSDGGTDPSRLPTGTRREEGRYLGSRSSPRSPPCPRCGRAGPHLQRRLAKAVQGVGVHQLAVQKAAHLLHVSPGRRPAQPVAGADLLQQHVDICGLRSPPPHPDAVSAGEPTGAGPNNPPTASPACARLLVRLASPGLLRDPRPPVRLLPLSAGGPGPNPPRPAAPGPAPAPWGPGLPQLTLPPPRRAGSVLSRRRRRSRAGRQGAEPTRSGSRPRTPRIRFLKN